MNQSKPKSNPRVARVKARMAARKKSTPETRLIMDHIAGQLQVQAQRRSDQHAKRKALPRLIGKGRAASSVK